MSSPDTQRWVRRQALEARAAAAVRALAGRAGVHFEAGRPWNDGQSLPDLAPHLQAQEGLNDLLAYRGLADSLAQRLLLSDPALHERLSPSDDPIAALMFEWLEQWRVETQVPARWPGMRTNIQSRFSRWSMLLAGSGLAETTTGLLLLCFAQTAWSRLSGTPVPDDLADLLEPARLEIGPALAAPLARLYALRQDQAAYAAVARVLAIELADWFQALKASEQDHSKRRRINFSITLPPAGAAEDSAAAGIGDVVPVQATSASYTIWSRRHDRTQDAAGLVRPALLQDYRHQLDTELSRQPWSITRLVRAIRQSLEQPHIEGRLSGQEEGLIDGRRLAQLISSPHNRAVFYQDRQTPIVQAHITVLVDCSGSMRHHGLQLALLMDLLGRAFERVDIPFELLGFTTLAWNGGRPAREWSSQGRQPAHPGRLNEVQHLIFRAQDTPRRQGHLGLTAIMKPDLFREGIDGEAVQWACERLLAQPGQNTRRILWVVSDGGPMDSATALANPPGFLDRHLRDVVQRNTREQGIEILGVGVGQDLSAYYPHSVALDLEDGLDMHGVLSLIRTLARRHA